MTGSAAGLAIIGVALSFLPLEAAAYLGVEASPSTQLLFQLLGALYFAFAMLNWMAKDSAIGGIYNRPIAIANFAHFLMGALTLVKGISKVSGSSTVIIILTVFYVLMAVLFGLIFFRNPAAVKRATAV